MAPALQRGVNVKVFAPAALALLCATSHAGPMEGQIVPDESRPAWFEHNLECPHFLCGPGDPEDFLYRGALQPDGTRSGDQLELIDTLRETGANSIYLQVVRSHGGDGDATHNPFIDHNPSAGLNPAILAQWDGWFQALEEAGVAVFLFFYDDASCIWGCGWTDDVPPAEEAFLRAIVDRFEHHPNIVWVPSEEYQDVFTTPRVGGMVHVIRESDDHVHVIAVHQAPGLEFEFSDDPAVQQFAVQYGDATSTRDQLHDAAVYARVASAGRYNVNMSEIPHEGLGTGPEARRKLWAMAMGGAYVMAQGWLIDGTPVARLEECGYMVSFMEGTQQRYLEPRDDLAAGSTDYVLADPSRGLFVAYSSNAGSPMGLTGMPYGRYNFRWLDTIDGKIREWLGVDIGGTNFFSVPPDLGPEVALYARFAALDAVRNLTFAPDKRTLRWCDGSLAGSCTLTATYDTLRSSSPFDWSAAKASCVESDQSDASAQDFAVPAPGKAFFYLVRLQTSCSGGQSSLGVDSSGTARVGRTCP